jgi:L-cysteine S-thiosulfotransferase
MTTGSDHRRARVAVAAAAQSAAMALAAFAGAATPCAAAGAADTSGMAPLHIVADGIPEPLAATAGDVARGRALIIARESANCVLCHAVPDAALRFAGNVGPSLAGIGGRFTAAQLRLRVADNLRVNPASVMPSYYRVSGLNRVAEQYVGAPILTAAEVEDVVAYLTTLR